MNKNVNQLDKPSSPGWNIFFKPRKIGLNDVGESLKDFMEAGKK